MWQLSRFSWIKREESCIFHLSLPFLLGFLRSGISEVVFLISLSFVCIAQKVSFKVFASMSEGRRERATQWFNFRFLLTKANSAGNYSSVVPNLGSFSFSCLKNKIAIYNFWASKISSLFILFSWQHCVLTSAQSVRSNNTKHNEGQWPVMDLATVLCSPLPLFKDWLQISYKRHWPESRVFQTSETAVFV